MADRKGQTALEKNIQTLEKLVIEYVPIDVLAPNSWNPNRQSDRDFELLCRSMREDGFTQPVIALRDSKIIVDGEHRWRAAHTLGYEEIPVAYVSMTESQAKIATLRHNRARGSEDIELSADLLRDLQRLGALDWAQDSLMLDDVEIDRLLEDIGAEALAGEDFEPSWEPTPADAGEVSEASREVAAPGGGRQLAAMSHAAVEAARDTEKKLAKARTAEDRERVRREASSMYRLMLVFAGDEADLVKKALGEKAAEKLVEIILYWRAGHPEIEDE